MSCCEVHVNGRPDGDANHSVVNIGGFAELYRDGTGPSDFEIRTVHSPDLSITIVQSTNDLAFTVPVVSGSSDAFQTDSTATRLSNSTTPTALATMSSSSKVLNGETWKINMGVLVCFPTVMGISANAEQIWEVETSTGVFTEFDRYSSHTPIAISGPEKSQPFKRWKRLVASMDAPRMRVLVRRTSAGSTSFYWELARWGGEQIAEAE